MQLRNFVFSRFAALCFGLFVGGLSAYAGAVGGGGYAGHHVIVGDFNADGLADFILQALPGFSTNAEFVADANGDYTAPVATWNNKHVGVNWNANAHKILTGDFNGDGRDDLFLQGASGLGSAVLLADSAGRFTRIAEVPPRTLEGLDLSQAAHNLVVGDFNGDGRSDLLLQATTLAASNGITVAGPDGGFRGLAVSWQDGAVGLHWSSDYADITAGDFNGNGRDALLLRSKVATQPDVVCCHVVSLGKDLRPQAITQSWAADYLGIDWSPAHYRVIAADLNGDAHTDLLLQPTAPGGEIYVLFADKKGRFTRISNHWPATHKGTDWSAQSYRIAVEKPGPGHAVSLVLIPKQTGLSYARVKLDETGAIVAVKMLASPPPTLAAAGVTGRAGSPLAGNAPDGVMPNAVNPHTAGDAVGTLAGKFSVGSSGSASYRIPIAVAPGVNGLHPELAIVYSSRQGGSQLGLGWALSGLSAVTRCPATVATDGYAEAPDFTGTDRFCLDNSHLYANSGTYGGNGTRYHTNPASFSRITSHGSQGGGPQWFEVWDKSGTIREYGHTADSAIGAGQTFSNSTAVWLLDKITDRYNNFIKFEYTKEGSGADQTYQLSEIDYGNNQDTTVGKLVFDYQPLMTYNWLPYFASGVKHIFKYTMQDIKVYSAGSLLWTYNMSYDVPETGKPLLKQVQQCASSQACYPPTKFTYSPASSGYATYKTRLVGGSNIGNMHFGDVNGDGKTDLIYTDSAHSNHWCIYFSGLFTTTCTGIGKGSDPKHAVVLDANSDGYADLLLPVSNGKWRLYESNGSALVYKTQPTNFGGDHLDAIAVDVTGDGYPELLFHRNGKLWYYPNNAGTFGTATNSGYTLAQDQQVVPFRFENSPAPALYIGTYNCDMSGWQPGGGGGDPPDPPGPPIQPHAAAKAVMNAEGSTSCQASVGALVWDHAINSGAGGFDHYEVPYYGHIKFLDLNGDGLDDELTTWNGRWYVYLNYGGAFSATIWSGAPQCTVVANSASSWMAVDENGDGRQDLLVPCNGGTWHDLSWGGYDGAEVIINDAAATNARGVMPVRSISYTGNGFGDLVYKVDDHNSGGWTNDWYVVPHAPPSASGNGNLLIKVTNGLDASVNIQYGALSASPAGANGFYTSDPDAGNCGGSGPDEVRPLDGPLWVVRQIATEVASGITLTTDYHYDGAALDRAGRGFLGFAKVTSQNNLGYKTETDYCHDFPYTGMTRLSKQWAPGDTLISQATNTVNVQTGAFANFPYVSKIVADSYRLDNGVPYKEVITTKSYDEYGNTLSLKKTTTDDASGDSWTLSEANNYADDPEPYWCLGRLSEADVTYSGPIDAAITRRTGYTYAQDTTCGLKNETYSTSNPHDYWHKVYNYGSFGNIKKQTLTGWRLGTRVTQTTYDPNGRYATSKKDPLNFIATTAWKEAFGEKKKVTGPNGASVSYAYDGFGRLANSSGPHALEGANEHYAWCNSSGHSPSVGCDDGRSVYRITKAQASGATAVTEYDKHGRKVLTEVSQYGGKTAQQVFYYDAFGRNYASSAPYRPNTPACWSFKLYDALSRVTDEYSASNEGECTTDSLPSPGGAPPASYSAHTAMVYNGLTTTINANGHQSVVVHTVMGKVASKTLPEGGSVSSTYDAAGNLLTTTDAAGVTENFVYDPAGYRITRTSPTSGTWHYVYDAKGELYTQKDPTGNLVTQYYDPAGHLIRRKLHNGANGTTRNSYWIYGNVGAKPPYNAGRLESLNNGLSGDDRFAKSFTYNAPGDVAKVITTIGTANYPLNKSYDDYGRLVEATYPPSPAPQDANLPPVAHAGASPTLRTSAGTVTLDGSASSDPDHGPMALSYQWSVVEEPPGVNAQISDANQAVAHVSLSKNGTYKFRLKVGDGYASDTDETPTVMVAIAPGAAGAPTISPNPSASGAYTVQWTAASHATSYRLDQSANGAAWGQVYSGGALSWPASGKGNGSYRYKVRGCNAAGCSAWSGVATETVNLTPGKPTNLHILAGVQQPGGLYSVRWNAPGYGAVTSYELQSADNPGFSGAQIATTSATHVDYHYGTGGYVWYRVKACHGSHCSGWTGSVRVTNPPGGGGGPPGGGCPGCQPHVVTPGGGAGVVQNTQSTWRYVVHYAYDSHGSLAAVYGPDSTHPYWQLVSVDVTGAVAQAQVNGQMIDVTHLTDRASGAVTRIQASGWGETIEDEQYTYGVHGNRKSRHDWAQGESESYTYDHNNRLTQAVAVRGSSHFTTLAARYDAAGNFTHRSDRGGSLVYTPAAGNPDQLASVSGAITGGFAYDGAGRITSGPDGLSATWNARGLATVLHKKGHTAELTYAPDGLRYRSVLDATTTETYLAGGAFRILQKGGVTTYREAVVVGGMTVAQLTTRDNATSGFHYFFHDALGSIVAITGTQRNAPIKRLTYGPYGQVRAAADWSSLLGPPAIESLNLPTRRGYTGGEALTALGLVHLGARIYDPALGRWLSPDPAGASTPYVYVGDNPLSDTDPNGQMSLGQILVIAALVMASVFTMGAMAIVLGSYLAAAAATGAIMGFATGMIASNGNLHAGLMGALGGAVAGVTFAYLGGLTYAGGMFEKAAVEGFAGGAISSVEGGSFKDGFLGAFASSMGGGFIKQKIPGKSQGAIMERTAAAAALGGTASRLTGGSFANGAISAAFQHLFNEEHPIWQGMAGMKSRQSPQQMAANARVQNVKGNVKAITNCARRSWEGQVNKDTVAPVFQGGDPIRMAMDADLSHAYAEAGLNAANRGAQVLSETKFVRTSGARAARAARWTLPKVSIIAEFGSKFSIVWSAAALAVDIPTFGYAAYQVATDPSLTAQCVWNPY